MRKRARDAKKVPETIEVRYISESFESYANPIFLPKRPYVWAELRYELETCSGRQMNHVTYLRGYTLEKRELLRDDEVPSVLLVRRCVMPWGLRQHVPPEVHEKYIALRDQHTASKKSLETLDRTFLERIHSSFTDYLSTGDPEAEAKAHQAEYADLLETCSKLNEQLLSFKTKAGLHASEIELNRDSRTHKGVTYQISYVTPYPTYICSFCSKVGHHYKDACLFFDEDVKDVSFKVGAHKMKKFQLPVPA